MIIFLHALCWSFGLSESHLTNFNDHLGDWSLEKDCCWRLTFQQAVGKPFSESSDHLTLKMASAQVVETSAANNSPSQVFSHPDDYFQSNHFLNKFHFI